MVSSAQSPLSNQARTTRWATATWEWVRDRGLLYLRCDLLQAWEHGFFTKQHWPQTPLELVHNLVPAAPVYRVKQVHGKAVLPTDQLTPRPHDREATPESGTALPPLRKADGLVTTQAHESIWVCSADCSPVLMADVDTGQVAAIHAGWRGTAVRIVPEAIAQLQARGSQLKNLRVAIGPAIAGTVYQVAAEVALQVAQSIHPNEVAKSQPPALLLAQLQALDQPALYVDPEPDKLRLDVRRINALQLEALGLHPEQIAIAPHCTYQDPEHFFSYRRTHEKQVQWSGIVSH